MWSLYCDLSATLWKWSSELLILHTNIAFKHSTITGTGIVQPDSQLYQSFTTKVAQNDLEQPISPDLQLFQSFSTKVAQNYSEQLISQNSQLFKSFPTEVAQNDSEWPISPDSQLF